MSHLLPGYQGAALFGRRASGIDPGREGGLIKKIIFRASVGVDRCRFNDFMEAPMGAPRECRGPCLLSGLCGEEALVRARALSLLRSFHIFLYLIPTPTWGGVSSIACCLSAALLCLLVP
jgi:hypothetical protein